MAMYFKEGIWTKTTHELRIRKDYNTNAVNGCDNNAPITRNAISLILIDNCRGDNEEFEVKTSLDEKENDTSDG